MLYYPQKSPGEIGLMFMWLFLISSRETLIIDSCSRLFRSCNKRFELWSDVDLLTLFYLQRAFHSSIIMSLGDVKSIYVRIWMEVTCKCRIFTSFKIWFIFSIVQSIMPTIGIITGVAKVSCAIALLKSASSDDHIFLTLLKFFWNYCFVVRSTRSFYQLLNTCNYHLQPLVK